MKQINCVNFNYFLFQKLKFIFFSKIKRLFFNFKINYLQLLENIERILKLLFVLIFQMKTFIKRKLQSRKIKTKKKSQRIEFVHVY